MIKSFRHFGITVHNLDRALSFYCDGLNFQLSKRFERPMDYTGKVTGVSGTSLNAALITQGNFCIELLEYRDRKDRPETAVPIHYPGAAHICLEVDNIEKVMDSLINKKASFVDEITTVPPGPGVGNRVIYGWGPDGITFELVEVRN
jgi:catechol 2,3-dioxygenase-like lactoylglutathione lyase family enzyme